ncbi:MAG: Sortilin, neurotensin receptor 3 [Actinomycetota bacterium]|nr:Sortilin, neurotensin receptor 3 [Actinomycetota bacterium]
MRPSRLLHHRLALAAVVVGLVVPVGNAAHGATCAVNLEQRNVWSHVPVTGAVGMDDADPCRLIAVRPNRTVQISNDGGTTWGSVATAPLPPRRIITGGLPSDQALLLPEGEGLLLTKDRGRTWNAATGISGTVLDVIADQNDDSTLYAVVHRNELPSVPAPVTLPVSTGTSVYTSHDGGLTFTAVSGASGLQASAVAADPASPGRIWLGVDGVAGGLFVSTDSGVTFVRTAGGAVRSVGVSRLAGGGSEVIAATSAGFLVSRDGGNTISTRSASVDATGLALEWDHPSAFLALAAHQAIRSATTGNTVKPQSEKLPGDCDPKNLLRDRSIPSVFMVTCADGTTWRYRSDGTDLSATDSPDGTAALVPASTLGPSTPMRELARVRLTNRGSGQDGSIAFDGTLIYYADEKEPGLLHRQVARTGAGLPDLQTKVPYGIMQIAYDANRHHMFAVDTRYRLWDIDLRTGAVVRMFKSPAYGPSPNNDENDESNGASFPGTFTYDPATQRFLFASDGDSGWVEYDVTGQQRASCQSTSFPVTVSIGGTAGPATIAGMVATGDGQVYVEAEDDATVLRMDRSCHVLAAFSHEYFSEAGNENDSIACDTTSFPTAAIWLRNAAAGYMAAYEVPGGYCALPSTVSVSSPAGVAAGERGPVCADLRLRSTGRPLAGLPVDLLVAGRGIASPVTDARGHACADYVPLAREAGAAKGSGVHSARQPVLAAFLGTPAYRPSSARRSVLVSSASPPLPRPLPPLAVVHPLAPLVVVPVAPPAQPPPPPPNVPQSQPIAQGHPGAQPGAQGAPGGAMAPEDEEEVAAQSADVAEFRAREDPSLLWPAAAVPLAAGLFLGVVVARRRRASQVRGQWA